MSNMADRKCLLLLRHTHMQILDITNADSMMHEDFNLLVYNTLPSLIKQICNYSRIQKSPYGIYIVYESNYAKKTAHHKHDFNH